MIEIKNEPIFREDDEKQDIIDPPQEPITDDVIPDDIVVRPIVLSEKEIFNFDKSVDIGPDLRDDEEFENDVGKDDEEETILGF